jgi:uncharacterized protein YodC (DUF2158 family)
MKNEFVVGDVVTLKSLIFGNFQFIVTDINDDMVECMWFSEKHQEFKFQLFSFIILEKI